MLEKKHVIDITLEKRELETFVSLKVAPEVEAFFKKAAKSETETSNKWLDEEGEGLEFYRKNEKLSGKVENYDDVMDNFGNGLMEGSRINLALLRICGISEGVTVKTDDLLGYEETRQYIERLAEWTKKFYENNLKNHSLSASITFEVDVE